MSRRSPGAALLATMAALTMEGAMAQETNAFRNVTAGAPLRPGIYGRIEVRGSSPPPVVYSLPVVAGQSAPTVAATAPPVYLYVPPGQIRKWKQHCAKWQACEQPVLFVRVDSSPSRWGQWRHRREQVALGQRD